MKMMSARIATVNKPPHPMAVQAHGERAFFGLGGGLNAVLMVRFPFPHLYVRCTQTDRLIVHCSRK
jgi:hypothetical protein